MATARKLTDEQLDYIKLTTEVALHPQYGMHLKAKTLESILEDPRHTKYCLDKIVRSCKITKGGFISGGSTTPTKYLAYTSRYFEPRLCITMHRVIYMLSHNINLDDTQIINHIDGNIHNNHIDNLEIVTMLENSHISKSKNRQKNKASNTPTFGDDQYRVTFTHNLERHSFGTTKNHELACLVEHLLAQMRINIPKVDVELVKFIEFTKYKTLEERMQLLGCQDLSMQTFHTVYLAIESFNNSPNKLSEVKQAGVRQVNNGYRVELRVSGKSISFGNYVNLIEANSIAVRIRELKATKLRELEQLITNRPKTILAAEYYRNKIWLL